MLPHELIERTAGSYAKELGIDLHRREPTEIYKWFIASLLYGARISERLATKTYRAFEQDQLLHPQAMLHAGRDKLVVILDRGGYTRYDFKTASKLLAVNQSLLHEYRGDLNLLHAQAADARDLVQRLIRLGKGIGVVTANIFLRELRGVWRKADPLPSEKVVRAAQALGYVPLDMQDGKRVLRRFKAIWRADRMWPESFVDFEAALVRYDGELRKRAHHPTTTACVQKRK